MESAVYLFCLAPSKLLPEVVGKGVSGNESLAREDFDGISAVYCLVPLDDFEGPTAEERLQDLEWLGPRAVRHAEVIEQVMYHCPTFPARFGTLFSSLESLRQLLLVNDGRIREFLKSVRGKEEWAVKVLMDRGRAIEALVSIRLESHAETLDTLSPGARYFREKQLRAQAEKEISQEIRAICDGVGTDLAVCAHKVKARSLAGGMLGESELDIIANWAFLVSVTKVNELRSRVLKAEEEFKERGLIFRITGPWPPYSFAPPLQMESDA